jgi:sulfur carrier protein ThiS
MISLDEQRGLAAHRNFAPAAAGEPSDSTSFARFLAKSIKRAGITRQRCVVRWNGQPVPQHELRAAKRRRLVFL